MKCSVTTKPPRASRPKESDSTSAFSTSKRDWPAATTSAPEPEEREAAPDGRVRHPVLPGAHDPELPGETAEGEGDARENGAAQEGVEEIREEEHGSGRRGKIRRDGHASRHR